MGEVRKLLDSKLRGLAKKLEANVLVVKDFKYQHLQTHLLEP